MSKIKYSVLFLLAAAIVVFGAFLPVIVAKIHDSNVTGKINYEEMKAVELEIQKLTITDKLYLVANGTSILVEEDKAANTETDMDANVKKKLAAYKNNGLIYNDLSHCSYEYTPYMYYTLDGNMHNIFWEVSIVDDSEQWQTLWLLVDDETGLIFLISYEDYQAITPMEREQFLELFYVLYFEGWEIDTEIIDMNIENGMGTGSLVVICTDEQGEQVFIHLNIYELGFYNSIEEMGENVNKEEIEETNVNQEFP